MNITFVTPCPSHCTLPQPMNNPLGHRATRDLTPHRGRRGHAVWCPPVVGCCERCANQVAGSVVFEAPIRRRGRSSNERGHALIAVPAETGGIPLPSGNGGEDPLRWTVPERRRMVRCTANRSMGRSARRPFFAPPGGVLSAVVQAALPTDRRSSSQLPGVVTVVSHGRAALRRQVLGWPYARGRCAGLGGAGRRHDEFRDGRRLVQLRARELERLAPLRPPLPRRPPPRRPARPHPRAPRRPPRLRAVRRPRLRQLPPRVRPRRPPRRPRAPRQHRLRPRPTARRPRLPPQRLQAGAEEAGLGFFRRRLEFVERRRSWREARGGCARVRDRVRADRPRAPAASRRARADRPRAPARDRRRRHRAIHRGRSPARLVGRQRCRVGNDPAKGRASRTPASAAARVPAGVTARILVGVMVRRVR